MSDTMQDPGFIQSLLNAMRRLGRGSVDERAAAGREGAQRMARRMPEMVMPNQALDEMARRRARMIPEEER